MLMKCFLAKLYNSLRKCLYFARNIMKQYVIKLILIAKFCILGQFNNIYCDNQNTGGFPLSVSELFQHLEHEEDCVEKIYSSNINKEGVLKSIGHPSYPANVSCFYYLIGLGNERVEIIFERFEVTGVPTRCLHDYIDIYTQVKSIKQNLISVPLHGRFCGKDKDNLPSSIRSLTNILVIGLFTDSNIGGEGFVVNYKFINDEIYRVGEAAYQHTCGWIIKKEKKGNILSPTYPGQYPDDITCFYKLEGEPGERVKIVFNVIEMYYGGRHCPIDKIIVKEGASNRDGLIKVLCGTELEPVIIFSSFNTMEIFFEIGSGRKMPDRLGTGGEDYQDEDETASQQTGFNATFEISRRYVDLKKFNVGIHLAGSECDRHILSSGESNGTITSPYYPNDYPLDVTCHYYIDGLINTRNLENVQFFLEDIDIGDGPDEETGKCRNGFLKIYSKKSSLIEFDKKKDRFAEASSDYEFCGNRIVPESNPLSTDNPRLVLIFDSYGTRPGRGFKARYQFMTDYAIPGTPHHAGAKCHFIYRSTTSNHGSFNSPRHPSLYPDRTYCVYEFYGRKDESVRITFENFRLESSVNCTKDFVKIFKVVNSSRNEGKDIIQVGHYCGEKLPGPSDEGNNVMRVTLQSDEDKQMHGFRARYEFIPKMKDKRCFFNITTAGGGLVESPNFPHKYTTNITCDWLVWGRYKTSRILLMFELFGMEGNPADKIGCGNAVLKIYAKRDGMPSHEFCGENKTIYNDVQIISDNNAMRLKFISSSKATGGKGFKLPWTELLHVKANGKCHGFQCKKNNYCIPLAMKCNGINNCGVGDHSDETYKCGSTYSESGALNVLLIVSIVVLLIFILIGAEMYRRHLSKKRKFGNMLEVRYMTRSGRNGKENASQGELLGSHLMLKEKSEKVSIV